MKRLWFLGCLVLVGSVSLGLGCAHPGGWNEGDAQGSAILEVQLQYQKDATPEVSIQRIVPKIGQAPAPDPTGKYTLILVDSSGAELQVTPFNVPAVPMPVPPPLEGEQALFPAPFESIAFSVTIPFVPGAVEVGLFDEAGVFLSSQQIPKGAPAESPSKGKFETYRPRLSWLAVSEAEASTGNGKLDYVFIGDDYTDQAQFNQHVDRCISDLVKYSPLKENLANIVFHRVWNTKDLQCVNNNRMISGNFQLIYSVINDSGVPYDKVFVLYNNWQYGGTSYGSIAFGYTGDYNNMALVCVHESGHLFGLYDEYNVYGSAGPAGTSVVANCYNGTPPAAQWPSDTQYAIGCTYPNWQRASNCSIMLNLSCQWFNAVSVEVMKKNMAPYFYTVQPEVPRPVVTFTAEPLTVTLGGSSTLTWTTTNAVRVVASDGWSGEKPLSGAQAITPTQNTRYTLTAYNSAAVTTVKTVDVTVIPADIQPPTLSFTATPTTLSEPGNVTLSWSSEHAEWCSGWANAATGGMKPLSGSETVFVAESKQFTLNCYNGQGAAVTKTVNITMEEPPPVAPTVTIISPIEGAIVKGKVPVNARASDNAVKMELRVNGTLRATSQSNQLNWTWHVWSRSYKRGAYRLEVKAYDAAGNVGTAVVNVVK